MAPGPLSPETADDFPFTGCIRRLPPCRHRVGTVIGNIHRKSEASLWEDARAKAPSAGRPVHNLAWAYYETTGQFDQALALYRQASRMNFHLESHRARSLNTWPASTSRSGDYKDAVTLYERALSISPDSEAYRFRWRSRSPIRIDGRRLWPTWRRCWPRIPDGLNFWI